jgi:hypothetical protein
MQQLALDTDTQMAKRAPLVTTDNAYEGSVWDGVTPLQIQADTVVVNTNSSSAGVFLVAFPHAFPQGLLTLIVSAGDSASNLGYIQLSKTNSALNAFGGIAYQPGGTPVGTSLPIRINYIAIGW